jgi:transcription initiation factor TFIID subunit TAF12
MPIPQNRLPQRTTKTTTKLVLFPLDPSEEFGQQQQQQFQQNQYQDVGESKAKEVESPEEIPVVSAQSHAERLHKSARQSVPRGNLTLLFEFKNPNSNSVTPIQSRLIVFPNHSTLKQSPNT